VPKYSTFAAPPLIYADSILPHRKPRSITLPKAAPLMLPSNP